MVLAAVLLICSAPHFDEAAKAAAPTNANAVAGQSTNSAVSSNDAPKDAPTATLPSAPEPKVKPDVEPSAVRPGSQPFRPVKPAVIRPRETPTQRKIWYGLLVAGHAGAAFDAWSTHRAVTGGYGQEANPFLRPYANSNAIYVATQVSPAVMDYWGKRMMTSQHGWMRRIWWLPQAAGAGMSFASGAHNVSVVH
jgi:hypothetical protein